MQTCKIKVPVGARIGEVLLGPGFELYCQSCKIEFVKVVTWKVLPLLFALRLKSHFCSRRIPTIFKKEKKEGDVLQSEEFPRL